MKGSRPSSGNLEVDCLDIAAGDDVVGKRVCSDVADGRCRSGGLAVEMVCGLWRGDGDGVAAVEMCGEKVEILQLVAGSPLLSFFSSSPSSFFPIWHFLVGYFSRLPFFPTVAERLVGCMHYMHARCVGELGRCCLAWMRLGFGSVRRCGGLHVVPCCMVCDMSSHGANPEVLIWVAGFSMGR